MKTTVVQTPLGKLLVHADDFGVSPRINNGVVAAFRQGVLTSTSIMPNQPWFHHAVELAHDTPGLDIGIHFTLTLGRPLITPEKIPTLVDRKGAFLPPYLFALKLLLRRISLGEIKAELVAQLECCNASGLAVSHVDSHHNMHILPPVASLVVDLAREYNIPAMRSPELYRGFMPHFFAFMTKYRLLSFFSMIMKSLGERYDLPPLSMKPSSQQGYLAATGIKTTDFIVELRYLSFRQRPVSLLPTVEQALAYVVGKTVEFVAHPGYKDKSCSYGYSDRTGELGFLLDPDTVTLIERFGFQLISYRDL